MKTQIRMEYKIPGFIYPQEGDIELPEYSTTAALKSLPDYAYTFQIYKRNILEAKVEDGTTTEVIKHVDKSGWYYPGGTVYPINQLKGQEILYTNLQSYNASHAVKTRKGNYQPFDPNTDKVI